MVIGTSGDLRQVGDTQNLGPTGYLAQFLADGGGGFAADAGVDLIEDQGRNPIGLGSRPFQRQHQTRQLAARGDPRQGLGSLSRIGGEVELALLLSPRSGLGQLRQTHFETGLFHRQGPQLFFDPRLQFAGRPAPGAR